jgi:hypothetical protein
MLLWRKRKSICFRLILPSRLIEENLAMDGQDGKVDVPCCSLHAFIIMFFSLVASSWKRIEAYLEKNIPEDYDKLMSERCAPCMPQKILELEEKNGRKFPEDFKASLLIHDLPRTDWDDRSCGEYAVGTLSRYLLYLVS